MCSLLSTGFMPAAIIACVFDVSLLHPRDFLSCVFGALNCVTFLSFSSPDDLWDPDSCRCVSLGSEPVRTLLVLDDSVWASCGNSVTVIDISSLNTQVNIWVIAGNIMLHYFPSVLQRNEIPPSPDQKKNKKKKLGSFKWIKHQMTRPVVREDFSQLKAEKYKCFFFSPICFFKSICILFPLPIFLDDETYHFIFGWIETVFF